MTTFPNSLSPAAGSVAAVPSGVAAPKRRYAPGLIRALFRIDLLLGIVYLCSLLVLAQLMPANGRVGIAGVQWKAEWVSSLFDLNAERNLPTWYSSAQLLVVGLLLAVFAYAKFDRAKLKASLGLVAAAALFVFLSLDEGATIHENVGGKLVYYLKAQNHGSAVTVAAFWLVLLVPFLATLHCIAAATRAHWREHKPAARKFLFGFSLYLAAAVGVELLYISCLGGTSTDSPIEIVIEEVGEMVGVTILAWAAWDLLASAKVTLNFGERTTPV